MKNYKEYSAECVKCGHKKKCEDCDNRAEREQIIIDVINNYIGTHGYCPSINDIVKEIGIHKSNAHVMLTRMADKGYIVYGNGKHGNIRVI